MKQIYKRKGLVLYLLLATIALTITYSANSLNIDQVKAKIDPMLFSDDYKYDIIKISQIINNFCVVAITPPYREFPNIILFKFDPKTGNCIRVYEGLCLGIQDKPSAKTDLHSAGLGIDMKISEGLNDFAGSTVREMNESSNQHGLVAIPYPYFIHMHAMGDEAYTIDKTEFYNFALKLIGSAYEKYPKDNCTMYDMPNLVNIQFTFDNDKYVIVGTTDNQQLWKVTFDGVDPEEKYLLNKKIEVKAI